MFQNLKQMSVQAGIAVTFLGPDTLTNLGPIVNRLVDLCGPVLGLYSTSRPLGSQQGRIQEFEKGGAKLDRLEISFSPPPRNCFAPPPYRAVANRISNSEKKVYSSRKKDWNEKKNHTKHCPCPLLVIYDEI